MPTPTYDLIASNVLGSAVSSVTFSSISSSYRDLILVINSAASAGVYINLRFNSDTGSNYYWSVMGGDGSATISTSDSMVDRLRIGYSSYPSSGNNSLQIAQIMDYSATDKHKTVLSRGNQAATGVDAVAGRWASTSAINSVTALLGSGTFSVGGSFYLYGLVS
jgi:hypothetical protein